MSKIRVYQLAKKIGISSKELIKKLNELSIEVSSHMSTLDNESANIVIELLTEEAKEINTLADSKDREPADSKNQIAEKKKTADSKGDPVTKTGDKKDMKSKGRNYKSPKSKDFGRETEEKSEQMI
ncbi:MAG: translation initiation factor IF-2 N-terminal domain-containing protein, partial [Alkaliphilus sp.]|nr:translation initiation factor IF-2 N-terminal domain-containing protein [Alkaliphilus sp.]